MRRRPRRAVLGAALLCAGTHAAAASYNLEGRGSNGGAGAALTITITPLATVAAPSACASPANRTVAENCLPGSPKSDWYPNTAGDSTLQGFPTDISVNAGDPISFKIKSTAAPYHINIYRMGYYGGTGARLQAVVAPSAKFPQAQPACYNDPATHAIDCGGWAVSATWVVPSTAASGIYLAKLVRNDNGGSSLFQFIVREDARRSDILFQHSDTTYQGYNLYGGYNFYHGPTGRAYAVSFNRPPADNNSLSSLFAHEQPLIRFLESNGYDVSYFTETDTDRRGALLKNHKLFVAAGHDEYVTGGVRANESAARDAGVHLAFWTGNDLLWKARWGPSFDSSHTPYRTLLCYKETATGRIDPADPPTWTGFWRDPAGGPPDDAKPENELTGTLPIVENANGVNDDTMLVPYEDASLRFWRGTRVSTLTVGQTASFPELLGYEYDGDRDNGFRPPGLVSMSSSTYYKQAVRQPNLTLSPGWNTHALSLYKTASGALVFGAGTMQWGWGLDAGHTGGHTPPDPALRQAAVNLLADMGLQPATLQPDLKPAAPSTDVAPPVSKVVTPPQSYAAGTLATVSGTAADAGGGVVAAVEVSTDNGVSWHPAVGRASWRYSWIQRSSGLVAARSRAADDSANLEGRTSAPSPPSLASIAPSSAPAGSPGLTLDVLGSGFVSSSTVLWSGAGRATVFLSTSHLSAAIPASDLAAATRTSVAVFSPGAGLSNTAAFVVYSTAAASAALFEDDFSGPNGLLSNSYAYYHPTSSGVVVSSSWTVMGGSWFRDNGAAWTGVPDNASPNATSSNGTGSAVFRAVSKRADFGDVAASFGLATLGFVATTSTPAEPYDGASITLRYLNENAFYSFSVSRRDGTCVLQKKSGSTWTTLAKASCAVPLSSTQSWEVLARNNPGGSVALQLSLAGKALFAVTDAGAGGAPLTAPGALGVRGNNTNFRMSDLVVSAASSTLAAASLATLGPDAPPPEESGAPAAAGPRVYPNPWRSDRHSGRSVTIDGLSDTSEVRVYTVSGRLVRALSASNGAASWDLSDGSGTGVGSGVYLYLIIDRGGLKSRGVVAVIR